MARFPHLDTLRRSYNLQILLHIYAYDVLSSYSSNINFSNIFRFENVNDFICTQNVPVCTTYEAI